MYYISNGNKIFKLNASIQLTEYLFTIYIQKFNLLCCELACSSHGPGTPGWQVGAEREKNGAKSRFLIKTQKFNSKCAYKVGGGAFLPIHSWCLEPAAGDYRVQDRV